MADPIDPEHITPDHAPRRREDVTSIDVEGEAVIYEPDHGGVHRLDRIATVLWSYLDGSVTVRELGEDVADVFEEQPSRVREDVLAYVRELGRQGLLQGVRREPGDR